MSLLPIYTPVHLKNVCIIFEFFYCKTQITKFGFNFLDQKSGLVIISSLQKHLYKAKFVLKTKNIRTKT